MAANVALSVYGFVNERFVGWGLLSTSGVLQRQEFHRILVSGFLHGGPFHLFVNMITLFFFGPVMEQILGPRMFFVIYIGALVIGSLAALWFNRRNPDYRALGASGAVSGILFSFCLFAPFELLYVFFIVPVPAIVFAVLYVLYSLYGMGQEERVIGHEAHLGGAIGGVCLTILLVPASLATFLSQIGF